MADFKSRRPPRASITAEAFNSGNALSFQNQASLKDLFEVFLNPDQPVTLVIGAGVSVDAGFPTWDGLVSRLADDIKDESLRELAKLDADGPMRQAESIFRMISAEDPDVDAGVLRSALYRGMPETEPGPIAASIAKIWVRRLPHIKLLTTNFDDVLEEALENEVGKKKVQSFSLYAEGTDEDSKPEHDRDYGGIADWSAHQLERPENPSVMHLHGMTRRRRDPLRPVILSESHFLYHGPKVREVVRDCLKNSAVIFIGVSLSDPNLVGPLWDVSRKYRGEHDESPGVREHPCFVLHVPSAVQGAESIEAARAYVLRKYEYMEDGLGVTPVFFKSYSQLYQALIELNLALANDDYFDRAEPAPLTYGKRFGRRLETSWQAVGAPQMRFERESFNDRLDVADRLAALLDADGEVGALLKRPDEKLRKRHEALKRATLDYGGHKEDFGLFVWLRSMVPEELGGSAPYALDIAASSTYVHRSSWSFERHVAIEPGSNMPVAKSVYSGLLTQENLPETSRYPMWRGVWSIPLRVATGALPIASDVVTVGAVALNTTHFVRPDKRKAPGRTSILAAIAESQAATEKLKEALERTVSAIVSGRSAAPSP